MVLSDRGSDINPPPRSGSDVSFVSGERPETRSAVARGDHITSRWCGQNTPRPRRRKAGMSICEEFVDIVALTFETQPRLVPLRSTVKAKHKCHAFTQQR